MLLNLTANNNTAVGTDALIFNDFTTVTPTTSPPLVMTRCSSMTAARTASQTLTMPSDPSRCFQTSTASATTLLANPRFSLIRSPLKTPPLVMSRSRLMTSPDSALPTSTRQLAVLRSSITLMAFRTQSWVQGQEITWLQPLTAVTLTWANSLVPPSPGKPIRSASPTSRLTGSGPQSATSVVSSTTSSLLAAPLLKLLLTLMTTTLAGMLARARAHLAYLLVAHLRNVAKGNLPRAPNAPRTPTKPCSMTKLRSCK